MDDTSSAYVVMVVDDAAVDRKLAAHALERDGYEVIMCPTGQHCLEQLDGASCDLVLIDVNMPGLDGFSVLQAIKQRPHLRNLPLIMMSSDHQEKRIVRYF
jgi:CheY-like chemotaxis protein